MSETYTDSTGKVFPLNAYGRPQGYFDGNKFVFPKFGTQPAAVVPAVDPVQPVAQITNPYQMPSSVVQQQAQDSAGGDPTQLGGVPKGSQGDPSAALPSNYSESLLIGVPTAVTQKAGSQLGAMLGVPSPFGSIAGGILSGRGGQGILGDAIGTGIGTALLGPFGFLGGVVGGRIGDMKDMENALGLGDRGRRGPLDAFGYGFGLGPSLNKQLENYYGINVPGVDPFGGGIPFGTAPIGSGARVSEDDIGDVDPNAGLPDTTPFSNPFQDIADVLGGDGDSGFGEGVTDEDDPL